MFEKITKQRGQVSILFALLMPVFLLLVGVVLDLGWYYLNVSRLQNAADAAAVAGAQTLVANENFSDYKSVSLTKNYPAKVSNQYRSADNAKMEVVENISDIAKKYIAKNLSSREGNIINSWTKEKVETETPALYEKDDNLYFVVRLREEVRHFFLPGWFENMSAPVTAVALITKSVSNNEPSTPEMPSTPETPSTPVMPTGPPQPTTAVPETLVTSFGDVENDKIIVGNWEVQDKYRAQKLQNGVYVHNFAGQYATNFGKTLSGKTRTIYDLAWNHFQDFYNHYASSGLYRTQTIIVEDDVIAKSGERDKDNKNNVLRYGESSNVVATSATVNIDSSSTAYNTSINARVTYKSGITNSKNVGLPYTSDRLDSINIDFKPEVTFNEKCDWLSEDWDITSRWDSNITSQNKSWDTKKTKEDVIRLLRIHSSISFNGAYPARADSYHEKDAEGNLLPDVLWTRIESEPMLYHPDVVQGTGADDAAYKNNVTIRSLNSVNQIIINANDSNIDENYRPVVIFYNGPETNDVYSSYKNKTGVLHRKSLPVILNLNVPFRLILYAPNSPVVVIGDAKEELQGFVVAKKYMRLKTKSDFTYGGTKTWLNEEREVYYDSNGKACYETIDENGIKMFVDEHGDIQFADYNDAPKKCGTFDNFGRTEFSTEDYKVPEMKAFAANMLVYVPN